MISRWLMVLGILVGLWQPVRVLAAPVPVPNAKYEQPTVIGQFYGLKALIADLREFGLKFAPNPMAQQQFEKSIRDVIGDEAKTGIAMAKPWGGYLYLRPKLEESVLVIAVPITAEKDALALAERFGFQVNTLDGKKQLHELKHREFGVWQCKCTADTAYLALRFDEKYDGVGLGDLLETDKLIPHTRLIDEKETALCSAQLNLDKLHPDVQKLALAGLEDLTRNAEGLPPEPGVPPSFKQLLLDSLRVLKTNVTTSFKEGRDLTARFNFDVKTVQVAIEAVLAAKEKSGLQTDLAALKPSTGRYHALFTKESVLGGWLVLPKPLPKDLRDSVATASGDGLRLLQAEVPEPVKPILDLVTKQLETALKNGDVDFGMALFPPTKKDGHYTGVAAVGVENPGEIVKVLLKQFVAGGKEIPKEWLDRIKLNAAKAGDLAVHTIKVGDLLTGELQKLFGEKAELHFTFGDKAILAAIGENAVKELERASKLKPTECVTLDSKVNLPRFVELMKAVNDNAGRFLEESSRTIKEPVSLYQLDVRGGNDLRIRLATGQVFAVGFIR